MEQKNERCCWVTERTHSSVGEIVREKSFDLTQAGEAQAAAELLKKWVGEHRRLGRAVMQDSTRTNVTWLAQDGSNQWLLQIEVSLSRASISGDL